MLALIKNGDKIMDSGNMKLGPEDLMAKKAKLADLVDYRTASVVSRTLIDKEPGTVTLFAFDKGEGLSEHTAPYDALVYILDGQAEISIVGKSHRLEEGEIIIMPSNQPHALKALEKFKMMLIMVRSP